MLEIDTWKGGGGWVGGCRCAVSWCYLDLTFDLAVVKSILGCISETVRCRKLILSSDIERSSATVA